MCPKGDDPWTTEQNNRAIGLIVKSTNTSVPLDGFIGIKLYGSTSYIPLSSPSNTKCQESLQNSTQIGTVECNYTVISSFEHIIGIIFTSWPTYNLPDNNIFTNNGNPDITDFFCDISLINTIHANKHNSTLICHFYNIQTHNIKGK